jgi:hypothetical protein
MESEDKILEKDFGIELEGASVAGVMKKMIQTSR